jgi:hypothetical protein
MVKNIGSIDKVIRLLIGIVVFALILGGNLTGISAVILGIIGAVLAGTALVGTCPIYLGLRLSTNKGTKVKSQNI